MLYQFRWSELFCFLLEWHWQVSFLCRQTATKIQSLFRTNIYFDVRFCAMFHFSYHPSCSEYWLTSVFKQDYTHSLVDITICQRCVRRWLAKRKVKKKWQHESFMTAAVTVQSMLRGYLTRCDYVCIFCLLLLYFCTYSHLLLYVINFCSFRSLWY